MPENDPICAACGRPRSEHHEFTTIHTPVLPPGCKCNPKDWRQVDTKGRTFVIPPICAAYTLDDTMPGQCVMCEHLEECHAGHPPAPAMLKAA